MLRLPRSNSRRSVDVSVVPMINIVFLLLLYFLVAGRLTADDGPQVRLPAGGAEKRPAPATLVIHVQSDDRVSINGTVVGDAELAGRMAAAASQAVAHVVVRADASASAQALHRILDAGQAANLKSIELTTVAGP